MMNKNQKGFSLIELLIVVAIIGIIVVAIIGIIAAIAIPNLLASRRAANEGSAEQSLRTISSAEATYQSTAGGGSYGTMNDLGSQSLVDSVLASGQKSGYNFAVTVTNPTTQFVGGAAPVTYTGVTATGTREFCIDETGVLRAKTAAGSTASTTCGSGFGNPIGN